MPMFARRRRRADRRNIASGGSGAGVMSFTTIVKVKNSFVLDTGALASGRYRF
jgi:hypothetical protein